MKLPKSFLPNKNLDKKTKQLIDEYENYISRKNAPKDVLKAMFKLDLDGGVLYTGLEPLDFKKSNLPYENVVYAGIACARIGEGFYRYRFNYKSQGLRLLEVVDTRLEDEYGFKQLINHVRNYYNLPKGKRTHTDKYLLELSKPQSKQDLMDVIEKFYALKFAYSGREYNPYFTKILYQGLTEEEFIKSNIPLKCIAMNFKNHSKLLKNS